MHPVKDKPGLVELGGRLWHGAPPVPAVGFASETTLFGIVWFGTRRDRRLDSGRAAATARRVFDAHTILRESSAATMSFPASNEPIADRDSIHKSCRTLEAVVNVLNDYCEAANAIVTLQRKLVKALRDAAAVKYVPDIPCT